MTLSKKKVATESTNFKQRFDSDSIKKDLKKIGSICQQCMTKLDQKIDDSSREHSNIWINKINSTHETEIEEIYEIAWLQKRLEELKTWQKIIYTKLQQERKKEDLKKINLAIDQQCEAIQDKLNT